MNCGCVDWLEYPFANIEWNYTCGAGHYNVARWDQQHFAMSRIIFLKGDTMIKAVLYDPTSKQLRDGGVELIDAWDQTPGAMIWVVIESESREIEADLISQRFGVHELALADALRDRHPPKIEPFVDNTFILMKGLDSTSTTLDLKTIQLALFIGKRFLVTRSSGHSISTAKVISELVTGKMPPDITRAALAIRLCRTMADRFLPILLAVETRLAEMETEMIEAPSDRLLGELVKQKSGLKYLLRTLQYHSQIFASAMSTMPQELAGHDHELHDVGEQFDRLLSLARLYYELTDDLMNGYLSLSAHKLNQIMQTLTIVTVIFVPITFMAGVYGMNFENMPELKNRSAYFILLGLMLLVVGGILVTFRRRGWLGRGKRAKD